MPTYDYLCNECGCEFEQFHGFNKTPEPCKCGSSDIKIVINQVPMGFVKGEPTTLGQLAESNTKNMGSYERSEKRAKQQEGNLKKQKLKDVGCFNFKPCMGLLQNEIKLKSIQVSL